MIPPRVALAVGVFLAAAPVCGQTASSRCGLVAFDGVPLTAGTVSLEPEKGGGPLASIRDGRFCFRAVPSGKLRVRVAPAGHWAPGLPAAPAGAGEGWRVEATAGGGWTVSDAAASARTDLLSVGLKTAPAEKEWPRLGAVLLPAAGSGVAPAGLVLVHVEAKDGPFQNQDPERTPGTYHLARFVAADKPYVAFPVAPGRLLGIWTLWGDLAISGMRAPAGGTDRSGPGRLEISLRPGGSVSGRAFVPGGLPFSSSVSSDPSKRRLLRVRAQPLWEEDTSSAAGLVDSEGSYELASVAPGFTRLVAEADGGAFAWAVPAARAVWIAPGSQVVWEVTLTSASRVGFAGGSWVPPATKGPAHADVLQPWMSRPRERWLIGLPSRMDASVLPHALLFPEEGDFALLQDPAGWRPRERDNDGQDWAPASAGPSLALLVEVTDRWRAPSARVLASARTDLPAGALARIPFPAEARRATGTATLSVTLPEEPVARVPLDRVTSLADLHRRVAAAAVVIGPDGGLAGAAFQAISFDDLSDLLRAEAAGDAGLAAEIRGRMPRRMLLDGLPPGKHAVEIRIPGQEPVYRDAALEAGKTTELVLP